MSLAHTGLTIKPCARYWEHVCASLEQKWFTRLLVESYALSCSLLPLSLLLKFTWYPSDPDVARQAFRCKTSDLCQSRDRPRLKQSTIERLSLCTSGLQSCTGRLWAARSAALTRAWASSFRISSSKNHLSAMTSLHE